MTQIISFDDLRKDRPAELIFIRAVIAADAVHSAPDGNYELEFKVQGKEVDFRKFCHAFEQVYDAEIAAAAEKRLKEMLEFNALQEKLDELRSSLVCKVDELISKYDDVWPRKSI